MQPSISGAVVAASLAAGAIVLGLGSSAGCMRSGFEVYAVCDPAACALGCAPSGGGCRRLAPSNLADLALVGAATGALHIGAETSEVVTLNSDSGAILDERGTSLRAIGEGLLGGIHFAIVAQASHPHLGVFSMQGLTVAAGSKLRLAGVRAVVLLVDGDVMIEGLVSADASDPPFAGPGGFGGGEIMRAGKGPGAGGVSAPHQACDFGGGGGGFGGAGGAGGVEGMCSPASGAPGGPAAGEDELVPLFGGSGGAGGGHLGGGVGGGGGGALQISSQQRIFIAAGGGVSAAGAGAGETGADLDDACGGGGGGAGGALLLEAPEIVVDGFLAANGGGGGGGGFIIGDLSASAGEGGGCGDVPAAGGASTSGPGGQGGAGSQLDGEPGGDSYNLEDKEAGGGGGGVGRIRLNTWSGQASVSGLVSPSLSSAAVSQGLVQLDD